MYTSQLFLFAPGSITGQPQFHGRLLNLDLGRDVFPPIGGRMIKMGVGELLYP